MIYDLLLDSVCTVPPKRDVSAGLASSKFIGDLLIAMGETGT